MDIGKLLRSLPPRSRLYLTTALYGLLGGGIAVAFHKAIHGLYEATFVEWSHLSTLSFAWRTLLLMLGAALLAGWLVQRICPAAAGSGIPQMKLAFWKDFGWMPARLIGVKFVAGLLSIGGGLSLGREGPSVQLAGASGSWLAGKLGIAKSGHRMPAAAGAAAGLAAAFNTPLAAVIFVLEEIIGDLNSRFLGNVLMASVLGALVAHGLLGPEPAFHMTVHDEPGWSVYMLTPVIAAVAALVGVLFQWSALRIRERVKGQTKIPAWLMPVVGVVVTWGLGVAVWSNTGRLGVFSLGYGDLSDALTGALPWKLAAVLLAAKLIATACCYGCGGCGGVFAPTLFFGGMTGLATAGLAGVVMPLSGPDQVALAVVGMCACLGAVVRAPVTGILIVFEMTHQFSIILPLMLGLLISHSISRRLARVSFYDMLLEQDGHHLTRIIPPRDFETWQQLPVSAIANFHPVALASLEAEALRDMLGKHPYSNFPVITDGRVSGVLSRKELERVLLTQSDALPEPPVLARPAETIGVIQERLIQSGAGMIVVCDHQDALLGVVTLHDLVRAQMAYGQALGKQESA